jgi:hypothetical protein
MTAFSCKPPLYFCSRGHLSAVYAAHCISSGASPLTTFVACFLSLINLADPCRQCPHHFFSFCKPSDFHGQPADRVCRAPCGASGATVLQHTVWRDQGGFGNGKRQRRSPLLCSWQVCCFLGKLGSSCRADMRRAHVRHVRDTRHWGFQASTLACWH